ncbi:hypothetical protein [uncultured Oceanisphaera sp.]|uniref:hypothetical protein n=1 Tax=uncultured Oceanisphaera sp. TaxID=353858 RepID=UPI002616D54A|nr:hypothetical protein [uncultured Oceanisphaera sp.]
MNEEISIEVNGKKYTAEYFVNGDTLTVYLPDGDSRETELKGLSPASAARPHLISYITKNT